MNSFFTDLTAGGLTGVRLVTPDAHRSRSAALPNPLRRESEVRNITDHVAGREGDTPEYVWASSAAWINALRVTSMTR
ncbi:hypothetical protein GCM10009691_41410 [Brevibacterium picturae]|uniref:Uncharacterized protein n=1 Tax=Brevibacterium picturae TaxID=260553 RepID=A0ABN2CST4_9MICO